MRSVRHWRTLVTLCNGALYAPKDIGVPVGRRRLYIVAVRTDLCFEFAWPTPQVHPIRLLDIVGPAPPGEQLNEPPVGARW